MGTERRTISAAELELLVLRRDHVTLARLHNIGVMHWKAAGTQEAVDALMPGMQKLAASHPRGMSLIALIDDGAGVPAPDSRRAITQMMAAVSSRLVCTGVVLRGAGFWASVMQSVLTGMRLLAPPRDWTMRFARDTDELTQWFPGEHEECTGVFVDAATLATTMSLVLSAQARDVAPRAALDVR